MESNIIDYTLQLDNIYNALQYLSNQIHFIIVVSLLIFFSVLFYSAVKKFI